MKKTAGALVGLVATGPLLLALPIVVATAGSASAACVPMTTPSWVSPVEAAMS